MEKKPTLADKVIRFCLENKLVVILITLLIVVWGLINMPFDYDIAGLARDPVPVDAIPDIGENQQIVFTSWTGRSPQDVEDQVTYPLTVSLLGVPGVKTIRSNSFFGYSSINIIFKDEIDFYWSRTRVLEKLNSLPKGTLPPGVQPALGPDATALGQIFWYTLEGRDEDGKPTGGWGLDETRSAQDWYVRYALQSVDGVSEVASVGGFVKEYQVDVDPDAMRSARVTLDEVFAAIRNTNVDVGARTIEVNKVEYIIRGLGFLKNVKDVENTVIKMNDNVPIYVKDVAHVSLGPALRRGALDKEGTEVAGGVVVARYMENPLAVIKRLKKKIKSIVPGMPSKVLPDGRVSKLTVVPFYDRTKLINETLGTLETALSEEIIVTVIVVIWMVMHLASSFLISILVPLAVLMCFIGMKLFGVDANIMALSGIAIAIGTMVDMGIILCENILKHLDEAPPEEDRLEVIFRASSEVGSAVITAISTTIVSFLPVFTMSYVEGKLFKPLAYTKSLALLASVIVALTLIPPFAHILFAGKIENRKIRKGFNITLAVLGIYVGFRYFWWAGLAMSMYGGYQLVEPFLSDVWKKRVPLISNGIVIVSVLVLLTKHWYPLGFFKGFGVNMLFVSGMICGLLILFLLFERVYVPILQWILERKLLFLTLPASIVLFGLITWLGFKKTFNFVPYTMEKIGFDGKQLNSISAWSYMVHEFPGLGKEFMPPLDEGSYLFMPTTMPHASIGEAMDIMKKQDMAIRMIPEVKSVVGKLGRVDSALDPAPVSMFETVINYKSEYKEDPVTGEKILDPKTGKPIRQWRENIKTPDDIWKEIAKAGRVTGSTSAPRLQPIAARLVMLQSGMRAPMGVKVKGQTLEEIEKVGYEIERFLKEVPSVEASAVIADRVVGKPYMEIEIDRNAIARYGISIRKFQDVIEVAIGGRKITTTVEGRERYPVRIRYMRELRDSLESLGKILIPASDGVQIPISQLAKINYVRGPQVIKSEDTFLVSYVLFDKKPEYAEVDVVEDCQKYLAAKIKSGEFTLPQGTTYTFAGTYENQIRSEKKLAIVLPLALFVIFLILYFQFKAVPTTFLVFTGIIVSWSGGFLMIWLYAQPWFLDFSIFGVHMQTLFNVHPFNLSVAVWVGFIALFGIASDDGVVIATYLEQTFAKEKPTSIKAVREATIHAGSRRVRPCLMTTATTILALIPVLTSKGRGADVMLPMAIPSFGGMCIELVTLFVVPVIYCMIQEYKLKRIGAHE